MDELEAALAQQAPPPIPEDPSLYELPPLIIDGIPTPVEKMTQVKLNLKNFKPQDVSVKTKTHKIIVQSSLTKEKTDPKAEFERVARLFLRVYQIPADGDMKKTKADMTSDGVLIVQVPKMKLEPEPEEERCVAINLLPLSLTTKELFEKKKK
ncbi:protein lethal(2)essential for life-like [Diaphorina citri]|uniref:Protein lethal(2)essential for life-like n=1 Tax=Diaphorina citri TaxID=121845 RepID=A0A1S3D2H8_DIACI|nr:protein lethal(2)essential for life-like [Diaphorina citri]